jgi:hypothetical protein
MAKLQVAWFAVAKKPVGSISPADQNRSTTIGLSRLLG